MILIGDQEMLMKMCLDRPAAGDTNEILSENLTNICEKLLWRSLAAGHFT